MLLLFRDSVPLNTGFRPQPEEKGIEEIWQKIGLLWQVFHIPDRVYLTVAAGG
jgi:hypothetical protein